MSAKMTGSQALARVLEDLGVEVVFGLPGGAILNTYDALTNSTKFRHVLVRHEQGAGHAASGYAIATGKVGVAMVTSGPAATNMVTAIADANMDSVPMVVITGQVAAGMIGTDAFQEADIVGITLPITKHSFLVSDANDIPRVVSEAFHIASSGRPGVVLVDFTKTAQLGPCDYKFPSQHKLPGYTPKERPDHQCLTLATDLIKNAKRPAIYAGGGLVRAKAEAELLEFARLINAPVVTTLQARGIIPDSDPLAFGMVGMHGTIAAAAALQDCDVLIALGARFADRVTGQLSKFAAGAKVIQADIDHAEVGKNRAVDAPLYGDVRQTLENLNAYLKQKPEDLPRTDSWIAQLEQLSRDFPQYLDAEPDGTFSQLAKYPDQGILAPQFVIQQIGRIAKEHDESAIFAAGVGQHQMWASQFLGFEKPRSWVQSAGLGTMGFAIPAGMGAKAGRPESDVWIIDGDGCFQMTNQELATCRVSGFPIKVMLINNGTLGMPRQWQTLFFNEHYSQTDLHDGANGWSGEDVYGDGVEPGGGSFGIPDFVKLAEAYDCLAIRVTKPEEVIPAIERAAAEKERPVVVEFQVAKGAMVFPMVPAGASNDEIMYTPEIQPLKDKAKPEESEEK